MASKRPELSKKQSLLQLMECPICLDQLQGPRLMSCGHILCYNCIKSYSEKGGHGNKLPCPMCRKMTILFKGGVDNLAKFYFMKELRELAMREDNDDDAKPEPIRGPVCSVEDCEQSAIKYCETGCQFLCQKCYNDHSEYRITKSHKVILADEFQVSTEGSKNMYPPCHRHKHHMVDLYCRTCNIPICTTCSQANHRGHDLCELDKQAEVCKTKLNQIGKSTDVLIEHVKQVITKTESQAKKADIDIDEMCDKVKSTFKVMHDKLDAKEAKMLSDLKEAHRRVKKTIDVTVASQMIALAKLESFKCVQNKLADKGSHYDCVTITDSINRDLSHHCDQQLPGISWNSCLKKTDSTGELGDGQRSVEMKQCEDTKIRGNKFNEVAGVNNVKEVSRIRMENQNFGVLGMVIHRNRVYTVHYKPLTVYCYTDSGVLSSKYEHKGGENSAVQGMCLMMSGDAAKLVVSDWSIKCLVWISINDDLTMRRHNTRQLDYRPKGLYNDEGILMVCGDDNMIHQYKFDGQPLDVINPGVNPWCVTRGDKDHYVVTEFNQVVIVDKKGHVMTRYKDQMQGVKLGGPRAVITDPQGRILIADYSQNEVLIMNREGNEVSRLIQSQKMRNPGCLSLDTDHLRLYVPGKDNGNTQHVFVYDYNLPLHDAGDNTFKELITTIVLTVQF